MAAGASRSRCRLSKPAGQPRGIPPNLSSVSLDLLRLSPWGCATERAVWRASSQQRRRLPGKLHRP